MTFRCQQLAKRDDPDRPCLVRCVPVIEPAASIIGPRARRTGGAGYANRTAVSFGGWLVSTGLGLRLSKGLRRSRGQRDDQPGDPGGDRDGTHCLDGEMREHDCFPRGH
jgi:hypothetical protein